MDSGLKHDNRCPGNMTKGSTEDCCYSYELNARNVCVPCPPGSIGLKCSESCPLGFYGNFCRDKCNCSGNEICATDRGCTEIASDMAPVSSVSFVNELLVAAGIIVFVSAIVVSLVIYKRNATKRSKETVNRDPSGCVEQTPSSPPELDQPYSEYAYIRESRIQTLNNPGRNQRTDDYNRETMIDHLWEYQTSPHSAQESLYDGTNNYQDLSFSGRGSAWQGNSSVDHHGNNDDPYGIIAV